MKRTLRVLNIEAFGGRTRLYSGSISPERAAKLTFDRVDTPGAMKSALEAQEWDVILADYAMPKFSTLKALALAGDRLGYSVHHHLRDDWRRGCGRGPCWPGQTTI